MRTIGIIATLIFLDFLVLNEMTDEREDAGIAWSIDTKPREGSGENSGANNERTYPSLRLERGEEDDDESSEITETSDAISVSNNERTTTDLPSQSSQVEGHTMSITSNGDENPTGLSEEISVTNNERTTRDFSTKLPITEEGHDTSKPTPSDVPTESPDSKPVTAMNTQACPTEPHGKDGDDEYAEENEKDALSAAHGCHVCSGLSCPEGQGKGCTTTVGCFTLVTKSGYVRNKGCGTCSESDPDCYPCFFHLCNSELEEEIDYIEAGSRVSTVNTAAILLFCTILLAYVVRFDMYFI